MKNRTRSGLWRNIHGWLTGAVFLAISFAYVSTATAAQTPEEKAALAEAAKLNKEGLALFNAGKYAETEPIYLRSLAIREKVLGPEHADVAQSLNNLATLYRAQAQYAKAESFFQRALTIREKALGKDHPFVATTLNGLAWLYYERGQYAKAEPLYERALAIREKHPGADHLDLATTLN